MSRKLKLNEKYIPISTDAEDEIFFNGLFSFNITKLIEHLKSNVDKFKLQYFSISENQMIEPKNLDVETIQAADIRDPIILAEISPGHFNVIDGNHRMERARRGKSTKILAYKIGPETHIHFLTTQIAYEAYVKYWNEKLSRLHE